MKWHRDSSGQWHPEHQPPSQLDELMRLLVWLIPVAAAVWTILTVIGYE